jgi:hypothetical protein
LVDDVRDMGNLHENTKPPAAGSRPGAPRGNGGGVLGGEWLQLIDRVQYWTQTTNGENLRIVTKHAAIVCGQPVD